MGRVRTLLAVVFLLTASVGPFGVPARADEPPLVFGVVPQQSATRLAQLWIPLLSRLTRETGLRFTFATATDVRAFSAKLAAGAFDIAYMNPRQYVEGHAAVGYDAFARVRGAGIQGIVVVQRDSPYRSLADLNGATIAFPDPSAFGATWLTGIDLRKAGVVGNPSYVGSHDSVYAAVAKGLYAAGGGVRRTFAMAPPTITRELRVLWTTAPVSPHAFAAHPRVPPGAAQRLAEVLAGIGDQGDPAGRLLLDDLGFDRIEPAEDSGWNDVRALSAEFPNTEPRN